MMAVVFFEAGRQIVRLVSLSSIIVRRVVAFSAAVSFGVMWLRF